METIKNGDFRNSWPIKNGDFLPFPSNYVRFAFQRVILGQYEGFMVVWYGFMRLKRDTVIMG